MTVLSANNGKLMLSSTDMLTMTQNLLNLNLLFDNIVTQSQTLNKKKQNKYAPFWHNNRRRSKSMAMALILV